MLSGLQKNWNEPEVVFCVGDGGASPVHEHLWEALSNPEIDTVEQACRSSGERSASRTALVHTALILLLHTSGSVNWWTVGFCRKLFQRRLIPQVE